MTLPPELKRQQCFNHPDRYGHALCMTCRKTVCQECATVWDGINYCVRCLAARRRSANTRGSWLGWVLVESLSLLLLYGGWKAMVWGSVVIRSMTG